MTEKVLIIEDNVRGAEILRQMFQLLGYEVRLAPDGEEGGKAMFEFRPDCVLLDVMLPRKSGYLLCREMKTNPETAHIPVILLTARNLAADIAWGYDCGADSYICKPYEPKALEETVARLIRESREGFRALSWTGLPSAEAVHLEIRDRRGRSEPLALIEARFPDRPVEVYCLKYGSAQFRELIASCAQILPRLLKSRFPGALCGQDGANTFLVLSPAEVAQAIRSSITSVFNAAAAAYYDPQEIHRGGILYRDPTTGQEELVPLMRLSVREQYPSCEGSRDLQAVPSPKKNVSSAG